MPYVFRACAFIAMATVAVSGQGSMNQDVLWAHGGQNLVAWSLAGNLLRVIPTVSGGCWSIAIDGQRNVWTSNYAVGSNTVSKHDLDGNLVGTYAAGPAAPANDSTVGPMAIDRFDHVYVGDPRISGNRITKLDNLGVQLTTWTTAGQSVRSIAIDRDGNVWAISWGGFSAGYLQKFSPAGTLLFQLPFSGASANYLYSDEWRRITMSHYPQTNIYSRFDLNGTLIGSTTSVQIYGDHSMNNIGVAPDGKTWVVEAYISRLETFSTSGASIASNYTVGPVTGISFDAEGDVWSSALLSLSAGGTIQIRKWSAAGAPVFSLTAGGLTATGFSYNMGDMTGMLRARTVDPTGDLDGDGHENFAEIVAGTSPLDPSQQPTGFTLQNVPAIGSTFQITIGAENGAGLGYFMPCSFNPAVLPLSVLTPSDARRFPISIFDASVPAAMDPLWAISTSFIPPWTAVFPDTYGTLGGSNSALVRIVLPFAPALIGLQVHTAFCTLDAGALSGVRAISPRISFTIQ